MRDKGPHQSACRACLHFFSAHLQHGQDGVFVITDRHQNVGLLELLGVGDREAVALEGVHLEVAVHHVDEARRMYEPESRPQQAF